MLFPFLISFFFSFFSSVRVHGYGFNFPSPLAVKWQWIKVPVFVPSFLRVDTRANTQRSHLRVVLFRSSNETVAPLDELAVENRKISQLYHLQPAEMVYFLGVGALAAANDDTPCPSFSLDMAMAPERALREALQNPYSPSKYALPLKVTADEACPRRLPPNRIAVSNKGYAKSTIKDASFAKSFSGPLVSEPMAFSVRNASYIQAVVFHNYLSSRYYLVLEKTGVLGAQQSHPTMSSPHMASAPAHVVLRSKEEPAISAETEAQKAVGDVVLVSDYTVVHSIDYQTILKGFLVPGDYLLSINERLGNVYAHWWQGEEPCRVFTWSLTIEPLEAHDFSASTAGPRHMPHDEADTDADSDEPRDLRSREAQKDRFADLPSSAALPQNTKRSRRDRTPPHDDESDLHAAGGEDLHSVFQRDHGAEAHHRAVECFFGDVKQTAHGAPVCVCFRGYEVKLATKSCHTLYSCCGGVRVCVCVYVGEEEKMFRGCCHAH